MKGKSKKRRDGINVLRGIKEWKSIKKTEKIFLESRKNRVPLWVRNRLNPALLLSIAQGHNV